MKTELLKILIKVLIYALSLIAAYLGVTSLSSCTSQHSVSVDGVTRVVSVDSTTITHSGFVRTKNYNRY